MNLLLNSNDFYNGRRAILSDLELKILTNDLQSQVFLTSAAVISHIKKKFGAQYSRGGVTELLHRLGFSFKKGTPVPGKANKKKQQQFINRYNGIKSHGLVYFGDSTHPEFAPTITYGWIKKGESFDVKTNSGWRRRVNICGAIEINKLDVLARTYKTVNKDSICDLLRAIHRKNPHEKPELETLITDKFSILGT